MEFFIVFGLLYQMFCIPSYASDLSENRTLNVGIAYGIAGAIYIALYVLRAIALFKMARKQGLNKLVWCAFVPFASTFLMGELAGTLKIGTAKLRHLGVYVMVIELIYCLCVAADYGILSHIFLNGLYQPGDAYGYTNAQGEPIVLYYTWTYDGVSNPSAVDAFLNVMGYAEIVLNILYLLTLCFLLIAFFRRYAPLSYVWMVFLCVLFPVCVSPLTFAFRSREPVDYEAFMRARYERMVREQQARQEMYRRQYGDPFAPPQGGQVPPQQPQKKPEDPFSEFSSDDPFGNVGSSDNDHKDDGNTPS